MMDEEDQFGGEVLLNARFIIKSRSFETPENCDRSERNDCWFPFVQLFNYHTDKFG